MVLKLRMTIFINYYQMDIEEQITLYEQTKQCDNKNYVRMSS